jgi:NTP pyrophosphatase (non-canonical NTP hydrolase)
MKVYIAGPINSSGLFIENLRRALRVATILKNEGFYPFIPNLFLTWQVYDNMSEHTMLEMDRVWLLSCDAMVRIPGESKGADQEERWATEAGIPVLKWGEDGTCMQYLKAYRSTSAIYARGRKTRSFGGLQQEVAEWLKKQPFGNQQPWQPLLGIVEEVGELSHAHLKASQNIRGTAQEHQAAKADAIGDIIIYLAGYCEAEGLDLGRCVSQAMGEVMSRDWNRFPGDGKTK